MVSRRQHDVEVETRNGCRQVGREGVDESISVCELARIPRESDVSGEKQQATVAAAA